MSYTSLSIFVNFGLLSTKWKFFKLGWCLHRPQRKCPLYARAFSLSCCCLKHLHVYSAGRPSRGTATSSSSVWNQTVTSCLMKSIPVFGMAGPILRIFNNTHTTSASLQRGFGGRAPSGNPGADPLVGEVRGKAPWSRWGLCLNQ